MVNYVRSEVKSGNKTPDVSSKEKFADDAYMKPVLEDDALLYSLDDITEEQGEEAAPGSDAERRVQELQEDLERLQSQFSEYRLAVQQSMDDQLAKEDDKIAPTGKSSAIKAQEIDEDYFASYAYNGMTGVSTTSGPTQ